MSRLTPIVDRLSPALLGRWGRFLASGAFNTLVTYALYLALLRRLPYQVSFTIAYASGIALAYAMNRYLVFRQPGGKAGPLLVALIYVGQYFVNLAIVSAAVHWLHVRAALAPLLAIAFTLPLTYLLNQRVFGGDLAAMEPAMPWDQRLRHWRRPVATAILVGLPVLSLALGAMAWLRFGYDLPFFDDWRAYDSGDVDSLELTYLFQPLNDTLTPIGLALDALAQRTLDGNSIVYQLLSMVLVLGALLLLQWKLLRLALNDTLRTAICFVFTLLMLQPGSYWGRENLAYEQALPLVFILAALWLGAARPWRDHWNLACIFILGLMSGFTYISGAFGALAAGAGVAVAALLARDQEGRLRTLRAGLALAFAGAATSAIQVFTAILPSKGGTHAEGKPLALPSEPDFWFYYLGKAARSLLLPVDLPIFSLVVVLVMLGAFLAASILIIRALRRVEEGAGRFLVFASTFAAIGATVVTYLMLVAAGRTHFRPPEVQTATDVFAYGFQRFHFFWATLLWPWMVAALILARDRWSGVRPARNPPGYLGAIAVVLGVVSMTWLGAFNHFEFQRRELAPRQATVECLMEQLQKNAGIRCPEWNMLDLTSAYVYARRIGASFVRNLPVFPIDLGVDSPAPWFRLSRDGDRVDTKHMTRDSSSLYRGGKEAMMVIDVGHAEEMNNCAMLDVRGRVNSGSRDMLMVYFRPTGQREFSLSSSNGQSIGTGADASTFTARLDSASGFESTLRIDFAEYGHPFELNEIEVRCRHTLPESAGGTFYGMASSKEPPRLQRLAATGDGPGRFKAGELPTIEFRTQQRRNMASCSVLEVEANYRVERGDTAQLFYRPRGASGFSERDSNSKPVDPGPLPGTVTFVVRSKVGFEDELRFDPVKHAQSLQFVDIKARCLRRILRPRPNP